MYSPSEPLWVLQVGVPLDGGATSADPIIDTAHPGAPEALALYVRERSPDRLAAIPRVAGVRTTLWRIRALSASERTAIIRERDPETQRYMAFRLACQERRDGCEVGPDGCPVGGQEKRAKLPPGAEEGEGVLAPLEWTQEAQRLAGGLLFTEVGQLIIDRAQVHPRALSPFRLPWGLVAAL